MAEAPPAVAKTIAALDAIGEWSGKVFAWLVIPLMLALCYEVIARYLFKAPTLWAYDLSYMLYGSHFMLGAGYALVNKAHIRTDFFYAKWSVRRQGLIDALLYLFFFFPGLFFFFLAGWDAAQHSWSIREKSDASAWRPIVYPFKTVMPVTAALLMLQGVSEFMKSVYAARTGRWL
jgi:TRAP-type mannitol/chloroaromatic compound transport system permease small subunit